MRRRPYVRASGLCLLLAASAGAERLPPLQPLPAVSADTAGNVVVIWESFASAGSDTDGTSIQGWRHDPTGAPVGVEFQVNSATTGRQRAPAVATYGAGGFVVVWQSAGRIQGQRYDDMGARVGREFGVHAATAVEQLTPSVATDDGGRFVVVWQRVTADGAAIRAQRFDAAGAPAGDPLAVSPVIAVSPSTPAVAVDGDGNLFVAWVSVEGDGAPSIQARRYDAGGAALGRPFQVNSRTAGGRSHPRVRSDVDGGVTVTWSSGVGVPTRSRQGQRYDADGSPVGGQFAVPAAGDESALPAGAPGARLPSRAGRRPA